MKPGKKTADWDPQLYLKYKNERTQPSIDLVSRIEVNEPAAIIDVGCGPGNSTRIVSQRWPGSAITGLDSSPAMIEKAKSDYPDQDWILSDIRTYEFTAAYDVVFSNSAIQWVPDHENLIPALFGAVKKNGALAVQIPKFRDIPLGKLLGRIAATMKWEALTRGCGDLFTYHDHGFYYEILSRLTGRVDIWETSYIHVMDSRESILEWSRSTGMRPYLDRLENDEARKEFERDVLAEIKKHYPARKNGKVLFPFKRLFFIAYK